MQVASRNSPWAARGRGKRNPKIAKIPKIRRTCKFEIWPVSTTPGTTVVNHKVPPRWFPFCAWALHEEVVSKL